MRKHGESHGVNGRPTAEYRIWNHMNDRCRNPRNKNYVDYGGRGITVCERWRTSYAAFLSDTGRRPAPGLELDRIDNERGYEPGNVRWATRKEQTRNTRVNRKLTANGTTMLLREWSEKTGINTYTLWQRMKRGWPPERIVGVAALSVADTCAVMRSRRRAA